MTIAKYLSLLRGTEQDMTSLISREFHDITRYKGSQNAIATTWLVSFKQIRKSDSAAGHVLSFISCIEPKAIPLSILAGLEVEEQMVQTIGTLCAYAFLFKREESEHMTCIVSCTWRRGYGSKSRVMQSRPQSARSDIWLRYFHLRIMRIVLSGERICRMLLWRYRNEK
jgi:hypothetical protein